MKFIQRVGYYLGGLSLGLVILAFFLNGKKVSCSYGPEARVLKNINTKKILYSDAILLKVKTNVIDTLSINYILKHGDINFSESSPRQKPCGLYIVEGDLEEKKVKLSVKNCDSTATITNLKID